MSMITRYWAIVPAAGVGRRMSGQSIVPKQYLTLLDKPMIEWSISALLGCSKIHRVVVALATDDTDWPMLSIAKHDRVRTAIGGTERAESVLKALQSIATEAQPNDWVLVHDAARPCLRIDDLNRLIDELADDFVGGLLATPVADTLKHVESAHVTATVSRDSLWRALTPQMFRFELLQRALLQSVQSVPVTDDASAVEMLGLRPRVIQGRADNIKVTVPEDLAIAAAVLRARSTEQL
jgi:2-C-methyl-D-erythritol 4-phosphate cytidylyltransferase